MSECITVMESSGIAAAHTQRSETKSQLPKKEEDEVRFWNVFFVSLTIFMYMHVSFCEVIIAHVGTLCGICHMVFQSQSGYFTCVLFCLCMMLLIFTWKYPSVHFSRSKSELCNACCVARQSCLVSVH